MRDNRSTFTRLFTRNGLRRRILPLAAAVPALLAVLVSGCSEPITTYRVSGDYIASGKKILVLPFMDTRTFVDDKDPHKDDAGNHARDIFVAAMREQTAGLDVEILTPATPRPNKSLTNAEVAEFGRKYGADSVVAGQVFSFTDTRAASIPPRAGMFVRVVAARDGALLFVGDHYQAAAIPGASGGRELQATNVATRLVEGFISKAETVAVIASNTALALVAPPLPMRAATANKTGGPKKAEGKDKQRDEDPFPGLIGNNLLNTEEWDEQIIPEVPPLLDFEEDFYQASASAATKKATEEEKPTDSAAPEKSANAKTATKETTQPVLETPAIDTPKAKKDYETETIPETPPLKEEIEEPSVPEAISQPEEEPSFPDPAEAPPPVPEAAADEPETPTNGEVDEPIVSEPLEMDPDETEPVDETPYTGAAAKVIDELPELDFGSVDTALTDSEQQAVAGAYDMSGDELAADLFSSEDAMLKNAAKTRRRPERIAEAPDNAKAPILAPQAATADAIASGAASGAAGSSDYGPFEFDPDTLELRNLGGASASVAAPAPVAPVAPVATRAPQRPSAPTRTSESGMRADEGEHLISTPLAVEQPRTYKAADVVELEADPSLALVDDDPLVEMPSRTVRPGATRLLILPYHDRANPNNLIPNTGGGEVVTTLYGTQLALDPAVQLMWDASGQATHNLLLTRDEAIRMGRLAGADYVMRGQVVEFRRAQSVPSFYSAVISTAVLAAQIFFAEVSGVDVATEVYRVSDGVCVMSRRDRAQQKYVVQAEKTVRRMAAVMAESVLTAVKNPAAEAMDPLIDEVVPITVLDRFK